MDSVLRVEVYKYPKAAESGLDDVVGAGQVRVSRVGNAGKGVHFVIFVRGNFEA